MKVTAIVLAAGSSSRFGENKLLAVLNGKPLLLWVVESAATRFISEIIVVTSEEIAEKIKFPENVRIVINDIPSEGMSLSIRKGMQSITPGTDAVLIMLGDMPNISPETVERLVSLHSRNPHSIVAASAGRILMVPAVFPEKYFNTLMSLTGEHGARAIIRNSGDTIAVPLEAREITDIDRPEQISDPGPGNTETSDVGSSL